MRKRTGDRESLHPISRERYGIPEDLFQVQTSNIWLSFRSRPSTNHGVPHISLVFREMWDTAEPFALF